MRLRAGEPDGAPDAIVYPVDHDQVRALLELCAHSSLAVVPFGGGTSVVGGVAPLLGEHAGVLALDTSHMGSVLGLDLESATVSVQAGMRAPALERYLGPRGLTLGHFPQSYEYVSLGGCAATRSAGQASTGYGAIERMVLGLRLAAPAADIDLAAMPASAAGPGLRQLLVGSEGTLGVISELSLRVRQAPAPTHLRRRVLRGLRRRRAGAAGARARARAAGRRARLRRARDGPVARARRVRRSQGTSRTRLPDLRGYRRGCLAIFGFEGSSEEVPAGAGEHSSWRGATAGCPSGARPARHG